MVGSVSINIQFLLKLYRLHFVSSASQNFDSEILENNVNFILYVNIK